MPVGVHIGNMTTTPTDFVAPLFAQRMLLALHGSLVRFQQELTRSPGRPVGFLAQLVER